MMSFIKMILLLNKGNKVLICSLVHHGQKHIYIPITSLLMEVILYMMSPAHTICIPDHFLQNPSHCYYLKSQQYIYKAYFL